MFEIFNGDLFSTYSMTAAFNALPYKPSKLAAMGLFSEQGVRGTAVKIDSVSGRLSLVPAEARGTMPNKLGPGNRVSKVLECVHLPLIDSVEADDILNIRSFGNQTQEQTIAKLINNKLQTMKSALEVTREHHRLGAVKGVVLDADGTSVLYDLFSTFGITKPVATIDFSTDSPLKKSLAIKRSMENALGATPSDSFQVLCGSDFFDWLVTHDEVKAAYARYNNGEFLRSDNRNMGFAFGGLWWSEYTGQVNSTPFVAADKAHAFPAGSPGLFQTFNAPADMVDTAGTLGLPMYVTQEVKRFKKGVELHAQANPLTLCMLPGALVEITGSAS